MQLNRDLDLNGQSNNQSQTMVHSPVVSIRGISKSIIYVVYFILYNSYNHHFKDVLSSIPSLSMMVTLVVSPVMMLPTMHFLIIQVQLATKKIKSLVTMLTVARTMMLVSLLIQKIGQMILVSFIYGYRISCLYRKFRYQSRDLYIYKVIRHL